MSAPTPSKVSTAQYEAAAARYAVFLAAMRRLLPNVASEPSFGRQVMKPSQLLGWLHDRYFAPDLGTQAAMMMSSPVYDEQGKLIALQFDGTGEPITEEQFRRRFPRPSEETMQAYANDGIEMADLCNSTNSDMKLLAERDGLLVTDLYDEINRRGMPLAAPPAAPSV
jgi:hypothetical protein